jgi:hypothetical protein
VKIDETGKRRNGNPARSIREWVVECGKNRRLAGRRWTVVRTRSIKKTGLEGAGVQVNCQRHCSQDVSFLEPGPLGLRTLKPFSFFEGYPLPRIDKKV